MQVSKAEDYLLERLLRKRPYEGTKLVPSPASPLTPALTWIRSRQCGDLSGLGPCHRARTLTSVYRHVVESLPAWSLLAPYSRRSSFVVSFFSSLRNRAISSGRLTFFFFSCLLAPRVAAFLSVFVFFSLLLEPPTAAAPFLVRLSRPPQNDIVCGGRLSLDLFVSHAAVTVAR